MSSSPNLNLTYLAASQAQKHVTVNEALRILDALCNLTIIDRNLAAPPGSPVEGDTYIVADSATGDWAAHDKEIALYADSAWQFVVPKSGWKAFVVDELQFVYWSTAASPDNWVDMPGYGGSSVIVSKAGTLIGTRGEVNLIEGANVTLTVADNTTDARVDVTVAASTGTIDIGALTNTALTGADLIVFGDMDDSNNNKKRTVDEFISDKGISLNTHTHPASDIASGTFADARITSSSVVQHLGGYVAKALFDANTIIAATTDDTPAALTIAEQRIVGRKTGGNIAALTGAEIMAILSAAATAAFDFAAQEISNYLIPQKIETGTTYTVVAADSGKTIDLANAAAITVTVPNSLAVGFTCKFRQAGAGQVTIAAGASATMRQRQSHTKTAGQWAEVGIEVRANAGGSAAEFVLTGDTA